MEEPNGDFVLDCSVTMAWCFGDEATSYTRGVRDKLANARAIVPMIWPLEVANAAVVGERRQRLDESRTSHFLTLLGGLPITVDDQMNDHAFSAITHLARAHNLSAYDAAYLELAMRLGLPLATLDTKLGAAARATGVPLVAVP